MSASLFYIAYGSNLHPRRLGERIPSCEFVATTSLPGYALRFHKRGGDGSGKCDALQTRDSCDRLPGALFRIAAAEKPALDAIEGPGYRVVNLTVPVAGASVRAFMYVAESDFIDPRLQPFQWYRELVYLGARFHDFHPRHLDLIQRTLAIEDNDSERHSRNERILALLRGQEPRPC